MLEGRDDETIEQCMRDVARTVQKSLDIPLENIRVLVNEVPKNRFSVGDQLKSEVLKNTFFKVNVHLYEYNISIRIKRKV